MKSIHKAFLILICPLFVVGLASCSKEEDEVTISTTNLLTKAAWKLDAAGIDLDKDGEIDQHYEIEACSADNNLLFDKDGSGVFTSGELPCENEEASEQSFDWVMKENNTIISLVVPAVIHGDAVIKVLNENKLSIYQVLEISDGVTVHQYLVLKH